MTMHVKKGEKVSVIAGAHKGKSAVILKVLPKEGMVVLDGINLKKRHQKANRRGGKGSVVERPHPIHASNVRLAEKRTATKKK